VRCLQAAALWRFERGLSGLRLTCWPGGRDPPLLVHYDAADEGSLSSDLALAWFARWAPLCRSDAGRERIGASQADDPQGRRKPMRQPTLVASVAVRGGRLQLVPRFRTDETVSSWLERFAGGYGMTVRTSPSGWDTGQFSAI